MRKPKIQFIGKKWTLEPSISLRGVKVVHLTEANSARTVRCTLLKNGDLAICQMFSNMDGNFFVAPEYVQAKVKKMLQS